MTGRQSSKAVELLVAVVSLAGLGTIFLTDALLDWQMPRGVSLAGVFVFFLLYLIADINPIRLLNRADAGEFTTSATFAYALLLLAPFPVALVAIATGTLCAERRPGAKKPWVRTLFNVGQVLLSYAAAGAVLHGLGASQVAERFAGNASQGQVDVAVLALIPAGLAMYLTNVLLITLVITVDQRISLWALLRQGLGVRDVLSHLLLLGLAPVFVLVWLHNWLLTPMLLIAVYATYRATQNAVAGSHDSRHDVLTGLPNRRLLDERLAELTSVRDGKNAFASMLMDLDRFKTINDVMGHHVGDQLLIAAAERLRSIDGVDTVARVGGDEFAFIVRLDDDEALLAMATQIVEAITAPYEIQDVPLQVGASLGIARFPLHGHDAPSLMRRADSAMYLAKRTGTGVRFASPIVTTYDDEPGDDPGRNSLLGDVEAALALGQFRLDHQPQVDMVSGRVRGIEALLRWDHPEHGAVPPARFVPAIEHTELYSALTRHVLHLALDDQRTLAAAGFDLPVSVNISARDLLDMRLARDIADLLADAGVRHDRLTLEITENALVVDLERAQQVVSELTELGIGLALDDFGTGYASLGTLRDLPVAELKIDRSFVAAMGVPSGSSIVGAIVGLAHELGLHVVAEGIETQEQFDALRGFGCDIAQGYLVSRPLPRQRLIGWLRERQLGAAEYRNPFGFDHHLQEVAG
ncbi:MAG: EAL domain-containing protein [Actinobacteria bacterium]|jgi:diguanylate cyclase (GGDEF)-like protein|nr:EAL domain-containing protein [Actinomycetota bacterium]